MTVPGLLPATPRPLPDDDRIAAAARAPAGIPAAGPRPAVAGLPGQRPAAGCGSRHRDPSGPGRLPGPGVPAPGARPAPAAAAPALAARAGRLARHVCRRQSGRCRPDAADLPGPDAAQLGHPRDRPPAGNLRRRAVVLPRAAAAGLALESPPTVEPQIPQPVPGTTAPGSRARLAVHRLAVRPTVERAHRAAPRIASAAVAGSLAFAIVDGAA